jgi:hypothetical protein
VTLVPAAEGAAWAPSHALPRDVAWRRLDRPGFEHLRLEADAGGVRRTVRGGRDASGRWTVEGRAIEVSGGPRFIDVAATPFTNSLPIRGCRLDVGESVDLSVPYLAGPDEPPRVVRQRYTRLAPGSAGDRYRYESLASGFAAALSVDPHGLVMDYPALFERVAP